MHTLSEGLPGLTSLTQHANDDKAMSQAAKIVQSSNTGKFFTVQDSLCEQEELNGSWENSSGLHHIQIWHGILHVHPYRG